MRPPRAGYSGEMNPDLLKNPNNGWLFDVRAAQAWCLARAGRSRARSARGRDRPPGAPPPRSARPARLAGPGRQRRSAHPARSCIGRVAARGRGRRGPADRLRQRRQPAAVEGGRAAARSRGPARARRQPAAHRPAAAHRKRAAGADRRRGRASRWPWCVVQMFAAAPPPAGALPIALRFASIGACCCSRSVLSLIDRRVFGVAPALQASRPDLVPALKDEAFVRRSPRRAASI